MFSAWTNSLSCSFLGHLFQRFSLKCKFSSIQFALINIFFILGNHQLYWRWVISMFFRSTNCVSRSFLGRLFKRFSLTSTFLLIPFALTNVVFCFRQTSLVMEISHFNIFHFNRFRFTFVIKPSVQTILTTSKLLLIPFALTNVFFCFR